MVQLTTEQEMGLRSGMAAFEAKQFAQALQMLVPLAEIGQTEAQHRIAIMYQNGLGCTVKQDEAFKWMRAAAEQGYAVAQHGLGFMYMEGDCVTQDGELAVQWFTAAAEQGLVGSQATLAQLYEEGRIIQQDSEKARILVSAGWLLVMPELDFCCLMRIQQVIDYLHWQIWEGKTQLLIKHKPGDIDYAAN